MSQDLFLESQFSLAVQPLAEPWLKRFRCEQPRPTLSCNFNKDGSQCSPPSIRELEHLPAVIHIGSKESRIFPSHELFTSDGVELVFGRFCELIFAFREENSSAKQHELFLELYSLFGMMEYIGRANLQDAVAVTYKAELIRIFRKCFKLPSDLCRVVDNSQAHISIFQWKLAISCKLLSDCPTDAAIQKDFMLCAVYGLIKFKETTNTMVCCSCVHDLIECMFVEGRDYFQNEMPSLVDKAIINSEVSLSDGTILGYIPPLSILRFFSDSVYHLASRMTDKSSPILWSSLIFLLSDKLIDLHLPEVSSILLNYLRCKSENVEKSRTEVTSILLKIIHHLEKNPISELESMIYNPEQWAEDVHEQFAFQTFPSQDVFILLYILIQQEDVWNSVRNSILRQFSAAKLSTYHNNFGTMFSVLLSLSHNEWFAHKLRNFMNVAMEAGKAPPLLPAIEAFAHLMKKRNPAMSKEVIAKSLKYLSLPKEGKYLLEKAKLFDCFDVLDMTAVCAGLSNRDMSNLLTYFAESARNLDSPAVWGRAMKMLNDGAEIEIVVRFLSFKLHLDCSKRNTVNFMKLLNILYTDSKGTLRKADIVLPILTKVLESPINLSGTLLSKCVGLWIYSVCAFSFSHDDHVRTLSTCLWGILQPFLKLGDPIIPLEMSSLGSSEMNIIHFFEVIESSRNKAHVFKLLKDWFTLEWVNLLKPLLSGSENISRSHDGNNNSQATAIRLTSMMFVKLAPDLLDMLSLAKTPLHESVFKIVLSLETNPPDFSLLAELVLALAKLKRIELFIMGRLKVLIALFTGRDVSCLKDLIQTEYYTNLKKDSKLSGIFSLIH